MHCLLYPQGNRLRVNPSLSCISAMMTYIHLFNVDLDRNEKWCLLLKVYVPQWDRTRTDLAHNHQMHLNGQLLMPESAYSQNLYEGNARNK